MFIFIVPLQSPQASRDWKKVSLLNERCLRSICAQTSEDFQVVMVCNEKPAIAFSHPRLTIIEEAFPIPEPNTKARMHDKWQKLKRGMIFARQWAPANVMFVDSDDCVSSRLVQHTLSNPSSTGWALETGYMHDEYSRWVFRRSNFHQYCGTSSIVHCETADFPSSMEEPREQFFILKQGHTGVVRFMKERGTPLKTLPFEGAVYNTATGENDSGFSLVNWRSKKVLIQKLLNTRPLTSRIRSEFGLYDLAS